MCVSGSVCRQLAVKFEVLFAHLDERQRRLLMGAEARVLGHGGIRAVARAAGVSETTVRKGVDELEAGEEPLGRVRRPGGGRKKAADVDPGLRPALLALVEPDVRGDPMSPLRWTTKSTRNLATELTRQGHKVSADTAGDLLREEGFSLQANAKTVEGTQHPDRGAQFRYINDQAKDHMGAGDPVISVDTKKKELVGDYKNGGRQWRPQGEPVLVKTHDFLDRQGLGKAIPYGIYDIAANTGWVSVGTDHDTAAFAVASIRRWWQAVGRHEYPRAARLLITADAGGSNGYRTRAWKIELAALAAETDLDITVCHLPPGTSKWNKVEHRLFSHISMNWRGRPLTSHEVIVNSIAATTTRTGLRVHAELDPGTYDTGVKVTDDEIDALPMTRHRFHGDWNYTLQPVGSQLADDREAGPQAAATNSAEQPGCPDGLSTSLLRDPELTGMTIEQLDALVCSLIPALAHQRERLRHERRGSERLRARGAGAKDKLSDTDRILAAVLCLRKIGTHDLLARIFGVAGSTLTRAVQEVRPLLAEHAIPPSTARFRTPADVAAHLDMYGNQPPRKTKRTG
ncbi:ISAzo13 family transposase [Micromonospora sp. NBC_01655]|uniref:ISAzo13 family transposase n=1 Tax=Micromonospora sp. NBC_01655 TaxID=2975983 RepID=UPI00224D5A54|nr:ISAzo13 family transposase [Micromonospora sp. NBC_01655]MCX4469407.1 ISAzo13 family transposase [Micromonospora sp. NBC_01655]MCX4471406.1 ISAzo13 family transposase [Micromonospora sp. NBC_01655]MCX4472192.1 ISAzo13 family transposase [Micromonospora sp. NBC_01655]MCX4473620.1 ISAzo13 family transposase [Micromonospora sp. NBC_01655]